MGECPFCRIAEGKADTEPVFQDEEVIAFPPLEKDMLSEGHLLVVPREHFERLHDMPDEALSAVMSSAKEIAVELEKEGYEGVNILNASGKSAQQSVPHFHLHLVPRNSSDKHDLWPETDYSGNAAEFYRRLRENLV